MAHTQYYVFNSVLTRMDGEDYIPMMIPAAGIKIAKMGRLIQLIPNVKSRPSLNCLDCEICNGLASAKTAFDKLSGKDVPLTQNDKLKLVVEHLYNEITK